MESAFRVSCNGSSILLGTLSDECSPAFLGPGEELADAVSADIPYLVAFGALDDGMSTNGKVHWDGVSLLRCSTFGGCSTMPPPPGISAKVFAAPYPADANGRLVFAHHHGPAFVLRSDIWEKQLTQALRGRPETFLYLFHVSHAMVRHGATELPLPSVPDGCILAIAVVPAVADVSQIGAERAPLPDVGSAPA